MSSGCRIERLEARRLLHDTGYLSPEHLLEHQLADAEYDPATWTPQPRPANEVQALPVDGGQWGSVVDWNIIAIHSHLLSNNQVLLWDFGDNIRLWDPATGKLSSAAPAGFNPFCSGHTILSDGRLLVAGGNVSTGVGLSVAYVYDPATNVWTRLPDMNAARWYPTATTLANGDALVISGSINTTTDNNLPQIYQVPTNSWRDLSTAVKQLPLYPFMFSAPDGRVFNAGPNVDTSFLNTSGTGSWSSSFNSKFGYRDYGSAVMYQPGKILIVGGGDPPTGTAEVIDLNAATPAWRYVDSLETPRRQINATILADGQVLVTGGTTGPGFNNTANPVYSAELWNPQTEQFTTMNSMTAPRWYHSTALLLPDGRVLSAGGNGNDTAEIYSPPYLFKGTRPTISSAPTNIAYNGSFTVGTDQASSIASVSLIRMGSVTHAYNFDQRFMNLNFTAGSGSLNVSAPTSANSLAPGYYMLFVVNSQGVPSVAKIMRLNGQATPAPTSPTLTSATPSVGRVDLAWTHNGANLTGFEVQRKLGATGTWATIASPVASARTYGDTSVAASSTYFYRVRGVGTGGPSAYSNELSATTPANPALGNGLSAIYFNNSDFTGTSVSRIDPIVSFNWGKGSPSTSIASDTFSARWTGAVKANFSQTYTFYAKTDDGVRLWVNDVQLINDWTTRKNAAERSGSIALVAGQKYNIRMEYFENTNKAVAELRWSSTSTSKAIIPQSALFSTGVTSTVSTAPLNSPATFASTALPPREKSAWIELIEQEE